MTRSSPSKPASAASPGGRVHPETIDRLRALEAHWANGADPTELRRIARETWALSHRQACHLVQLLREQARAALNETDRADVLAELRVRFSETYKRAMASNNLPVAVAALNGTARVMGLPDIPAIEARVSRELSLQMLEVLMGSSLPYAAKVDLQLRLAARGLAPLPQLERVPADVIDRLAAGPPLSGATAETGQTGGDGLDSEPEP